VKFRRAIFPVVALALGGCATTPPPALSLTPENAATQFDARSLQDAGLRRFLAENRGDAPGSWDFETLSWVAFYYHPALALARAQWATTRATQQTAAARQNPTVSLTPGYNSTRAPGVSPWFPAINFDFLVPASGKRARQQEIARADAEAARCAVLVAAWQVRGELRAALSEAAAAAGRESSLRALAGVQRELLALLEQRFASGFASSTEILPVRLAALRAESAAADAAGQHRTARTRIATALGLPLAALAGVALPPPPVGAALSGEALATARRLSLHSRADVLGALAKVQSSEAALALEAARQQPDFHLGPGYQWDQGANKWSVALTFELPIFHRNEGPIAEATARRAEAVAQFNSVQAQAVAAIEAATTAQAVAASQVERTRRVRAEVEKQLSLAQERLKLGAADQVELQTARLDLAVSDAALADTESAVALAAGQLEDALQIPFPRIAALADLARVQPTRTP
jgi:outer membrane protein TolC